MRNDKHLAIELRRKGKSYNYISKELNIPKGTLSEWFKDIGWSQHIKETLTNRVYWLARKRLAQINKRRKKQWEQWRKEHRIEAIKEFPLLAWKDLFVAGLMLYWAEGDNNLKNGVRLTNTDPRMIKLFIRFAQEICHISRDALRIGLILYPDLSEEQCRDFWSTYLGVPLIQFHKTQYIQGYHPTKRLEKGICMVIIGGVGLKEKIHTWIDLYTKKHNAGLV